jgi:ferredoxin-NADP reductase
MNTAKSSNPLLLTGLSWLARQITNHSSFGAYFEPLIQLIQPQWRSDRLRSKIVMVRTESHDMYSLIIKPHRNWSGFKAGQHLELTVEKDGAWMSRFFTISSSPSHYKKTGEVELSIQIQDKGQITPWLNTALNTGSVVNLSQASGDFYMDQSESPVLMIAGGSGITPFRAMLGELCQQQKKSLKENSGAGVKAHTLMYYARSSEHFLFKQELEQFKEQLPALNVHFIDSREQGFLNEQHLNQYCAHVNNCQIYLCGPANMIIHARKLMASLNIKKHQLHYEFFGPEPLEFEGNGDANTILFKRSNKKISTDNAAPTTLLELAEQASTNPVSGCRAGICHQCICQKKSGVVYNTKTQQYSDTGAQEIQLCISVAASDLVLEL